MCIPVNKPGYFSESQRARLLSCMIYASGIISYKFLSSKSLEGFGPASSATISMIVPPSLSLLAANFFNINAIYLLSFGSKKGINEIDTRDWKKDPTDFTLKTQEELDERIAKRVQAAAFGVLNILIISPGVNIGRAAQGLSRGRIQLQQEEVRDPATVLEQKDWTVMPMDQAQSWGQTDIFYVYQNNPDEQLSKQASDNPSGKLKNANLFYPGQHIGIQTTENLVRVILGANKREVVGFLNGDPSIMKFPTSDKKG